METTMVEAAGTALLHLLDPFRLLLLATGVVGGLVLGILPGIGGIAGLALLLPFTYKLDPNAAFALLLGLGSVTATGDPIPAILFGVPGGAGSAATVLDGLPMAKRGEAGRALSAAYMSSLIGGIFGALLMAVLLPFMRPLMLYVGSPELLAISALGLSMVAVLSGNAPLRGLAAAGLGLMLSMVGNDPVTGTPRWALGTVYLWNGLPLVPVVLGLFALPELCDLLIARKSITATSSYDAKSGMLEGAKDTFRNWWLVIRCASLGSGLGAIPGIGSSIIDWIAYGHALRSEKGARETFGRGDVRGVIASESANNAKEGGALIPTVVFGVPGSASMAILLGGFLIQGLQPGPDMLNIHLDITYLMIWSIAVANILGAGLCYVFSGQFARLATLRYTLILPCTLSIVYIGAFQGSRNWGDLFVLLAFGVLGWVMKQAKWPRPPVILGIVLGGIMERYLFISIQRYGLDWLTHPMVIILFLFSVVTLLRPLLEDVRAHGSVSRFMSEFGRARFRPSDLFYVFLIVLIGTMMFQALAWRFSAEIVPMIVGTMTLCFTVLGLINHVFRKPEVAQAATAEGADMDGAGRGQSPHSIHMDVESDTGDLPPTHVMIRGGIFFGWLVLFMISMSVIGLIPTVPLFVIAFMRFENRERWRLVLPQAIILTLFIYVLFDQLLLIPWPSTLLGTWLPALKVIPSM